MTTKTYTVPAPSDVEYWSNHNKPMAMGLYLTPYAMETTTVQATFVAREWDRSRWNYVHPTTGEVLRTVFTYF